MAGAGSKKAPHVLQSSCISSCTCLRSCAFLSINSIIFKIFSSLSSCDANQWDAGEPCFGLSTFPSGPGSSTVTPSTSFHGYFQSIHQGPKSPATSSVLQGKQGAISKDDSCGGLQPFRPPSPSPLMTAGLEWVGSYFWGHGEGSEVIQDESRLAGSSAVTTAGEVSAVQQECWGTLSTFLLPARPWVSLVASTARMSWCTSMN